MDKKKIKRIIAREGLILVVFILLSSAIFFIAPLCIQKEPSKTITIRDYYAEEVEHRSAPQYTEIGTPGVLTFDDIPMAHKPAVHKPAPSEIMAIAVLLIGYSIYLLIRFIIWAVRILREAK